MPKSFLIIRFSSLGDLVLTTALVSKIDNEYPDSTLHFLTKENFTDFVKNSFPHKNINVNNLSKSFGSTFAWARNFVSDLKNHGCDELFILDLQGSLKSKIVTLVLKLNAVKFSLKTKLKRSPKYDFRRILSILFHINLLPKRKIYLEHLSLLPQSLHYSPKLIVKNIRKSKTKILLAPDAQHWKKRWPTENWITLIKLLEAQKIQMTLVADRHFFNENQSQDLQSSSFIENLIGKSSLIDLPQIAAEHKLCVCSNSAWLHISEAVSTPVLSLAGPIPKSFGFSPWKTESRELSQELFCLPCSKHGQGICIRFGKNHHKCMTSFTPDIVYKNICEILHS